MQGWKGVAEETRRGVYEQIAESTGLSPFAVEKDWWVVQALSCVFELDVAKFMVFKGGTSLSKAWHLIERFSEDVDLAISESYFGYEGLLSRNQRTELRKASSSFTSGHFLNELKAKFIQKELVDVDFQVPAFISSDQDPRIIEIYYPSIISRNDYLNPRIQIELGCRSLMEPSSLRSFGSLVDEFYPTQTFAKPFIQVPTVEPIRTFLEKVFLLQEEYQRPDGKSRVNRMSRHLYDIVKLNQAGIADSALSDPVLYAKIVKHRYEYNRVGGVNYNRHHPYLINPVPPSHLLRLWEDDYNKMMDEMIYEINPPSFNLILEEMNQIKNKLKSVEWKFELEFPAF
jgi:hypothetical protein